MSVTMVDIKQIRINEANHPRHEIDAAAVTEYAEAMQDGAKFPPVVLFREGKQYYLGDGRHRLEAHKCLSRTTVEADVRAGGERDAILFAVGANKDHGIRRTNKDKRKSVEIVLSDSEWRTWSHNKIAKICNVSDGLVTSVYKEVQEKLHLPKLEDGAERKVERGGVVFKQKVKSRQKPNPTSAHAIYAVITTANEAGDKLRLEGKPELASKVDEITTELESVIGEATGADYRMTDNLNNPLNVYVRPRGELVDLQLCLLVEITHLGKLCLLANVDLKGL